MNCGKKPAAFANVVELAGTVHQRDEIPVGLGVLALDPDAEVGPAGEGRGRVRPVLTRDRERGPVRLVLLAHRGQLGLRPRAVDVHVQLAQREVLVRPARGRPGSAQFRLADVLRRGDVLGQVQVGVELDARLGLRGVQRGGPLAAALGGHLAARAPDEADDRVGVVAGRAEAEGAGVLLLQRLGVGDQLGPGGRRRGDPGLGELVLAVPDAADAAEPRHRVGLPVDDVVGHVAGDDPGPVGPGLHLGADVGQRALRGDSGGVGVAQLGDVRAALAAGQGVGPVGDPVPPGDPVHDHLGLGVLRVLLVELGDDPVHPGDLGRHG